ncbi:protein of unknown function [Lactiplantibacillus plantarum]|nr:hypothetical protein Heal19_500808 [Lactiplantibacillus plantarum]
MLFQISHLAVLSSLQKKQLQLGTVAWPVEAVGKVIIVIYLFEIGRWVSRWT